MIHFVIPGEPVGAGRPRATFIKALGRARVYQPGKSSAWKASSASLIRECWMGKAPLDEPVRVFVQCVAGRPKRLLRKKDPNGRVWRTSKPDVDNVLKLALDSLVDAGVLRDDVLVVSASVESLYARRDEGPSVRMWIERIGTETANDEAPVACAGRCE